MYPLYQTRISYTIWKVGMTLAQSEQSLAIVLSYIIAKYCNGEATVVNDEMDKFLRENPTIRREENENGFAYIVEQKPTMGSRVFGRNGDEQNVD